MFPIFTTAWALAILFHLATPQGSGRSASSILLLAAAIAAVFFPTFSLSLLALCLLQITQFWGRLPRAQSSEYFKFICSGCLVATYAALALEQSTLYVAPEAWFRAALPLLRFAVCLLFFASALHKLNVDFLRAGVSFAPQFFPRWMEHSSSYVTILIESFLALGLFFPATRLLAMVVLLVFFFVIGLQGIVQFSSLLYASALWFFDDRVLAAAVPHLGAPGSTFQVALGIGCLLFFPSIFLLRRAFLLLTLAASLFSACIVFVFAQAILAWGSGALGSAPLVPLSAAQIVLLLLFLLNEIGPYVGFKDWPSFRMYSNLQTGPGGNHLFLREWLFTPYFKRRGEVTITAATRDLLYVNRGEQEEEYSVPYSSLAAMAGYHRRYPTRGGGEPLRRIEYRSEGACVAEDLESFGRRGRSWLDFVLPPRFFYHFPASRPLSGRRGSGSSRRGRKPRHRAEARR